MSQVRINIAKLILKKMRELNFVLKFITFIVDVIGIKLTLRVMHVVTDDNNIICSFLDQITSIHRAEGDNFLKRRDITKPFDSFL